MRIAVAALGFAFLGLTAYLGLRAAVGPDATEANAQRSVEAWRKLSPGELEDAYRAAQQSFADDPLNATALITLSRIAEARGEAEAAARLKLLAGDMQPRGTAIQAEAIAILLARRDYETVTTRLDGLIRARPNRSAALFALAASIATDPEGRLALARKLASNPPWRGAFLAETIAKGDPRTAQRIFAALREIGQPAATAELSLLIERYLKDGAVDQAYAVWLSNLDGAELQKVKLVYDGGFDQPIRGLRFDWTLTPAEGLSVRQFPRNTASMDQSLQIDFASFRGDFAHLSQILRLKPGRYQLGGEVRSEDFQSATGLVFRLYCMKGGKLQPLAETAPLPQSSQWMAFSRGFAVPPADCPDQLLRLESRAKGGSTNFTRGQVALDNLSVDTLPELAP